jgi:hypothetical protein
MRVRLLASSLAIVLASLFTFGIIVEYYWVQQQSTVKALSVEKPITIKTKAFTATKATNNWLLKIKSDYFPKGTETLAVTYNDTFYGIFLISDPIYLPVLVMPEAAVVISPLDVDGNPVTTGEVFTIGEKYDSASP